MHLRDHRLGEIPDAHPALGDVARPRAFAARRVVRHLVALVAAAEVVAGRERRSRAADDRHRDVGILRRARAACRGSRRAAGGSRLLRFSGRFIVMRRTRGAGSSTRITSVFPSPEASDARERASSAVATRASRLPCRVERTVGALVHTARCRTQIVTRPAARPASGSRRKLTLLLPHATVRLRRSLRTRSRVAYKEGTPGRPTPVRTRIGRRRTPDTAG